MGARLVTIWHTQHVHDVARAVLALHPAAAHARHALVDVSILGAGTTGALMMLVDGEWTIARLYIADHYVPGDVGVVIVGVW